MEEGGIVGLLDWQCRTAIPDSSAYEFMDHLERR